MAVYGIFSFLDYAIYSMVRFVVKLIMLIANYDFFSQETINDFAHKVYIVLGVVMLFKIVIAAVQYMINPDTFDDKEKGMGGLLKKMIISIILLVAVEPIFDFAIYMQKSIVSTIPGIILENGENYKIGNSKPIEDNSSKSAKGDKLNEIGEQVAFATIKTFTTPKTGTTNDGKTRVIKDDEKMDGNNANLDGWRTGVVSGCDGSFFQLLNLDVCNYDYMWGISTATGIFLLYVMLSMTLDVGIRTIKLGILQMLAPIPISSYIVSKDKLKKFASLAGKVYADLFIRLGVLYFIVFFIQKVIESIGNNVEVGDGYVASTFETGFVKVAIIIALFMFAKNAPKFICDVLGIDGGGFGDMKDMFRSPGGLAGLGASIGAYRNARDYGEGKLKALGRAGSAGTHAVASRLKALASGKDLKESYKVAKEGTMARTNRNLEYANRYQKFWQRQGKKISEKFDTATGVTTGGKKASGTIAAANTLLEGRSHSWSRAEAKVLESPGKYSRATTIACADGTTRSYNVSDMLTRMKALEAGGAERYAGELQDLTNNRQKILDTAKQEFIEKSFTDYSSGDGQQRNVFAEDVFKLLRSGGDPKIVGSVLNQTFDKKDANGNVIIDPSTGQAEKITVNLKDVANMVAEGRELDEYQARAMSEYIATKMNADGGRMRVQATQTQTSEPKS